MYQNVAETDWDWHSCSHLNYHWTVRKIKSNSTISNTTVEKRKKRNFIHQRLTIIQPLTSWIAKDVLKDTTYAPTSELEQRNCKYIASKRREKIRRKRRGRREKERKLSGIRCYFSSFQKTGNSYSYNLLHRIERYKHLLLNLFYLYPRYPPWQKFFLYSIYIHFGIQFGRCLARLNIALAYILPITPLGIYPTGWKLVTTQNNACKILQHLYNH